MVWAVIIATIGAHPRRDRVPSWAVHYDPAMSRTVALVALLTATAALTLTGCADNTPERPDPAKATVAHNPVDPAIVTTRAFDAAGYDPDPRVRAETIAWLCEYSRDFTPRHLAGQFAAGITGPAMANGQPTDKLIELIVQHNCH